MKRLILAFIFAAAALGAGCQKQPSEAMKAYQGQLFERRTNQLDSADACRQGLEAYHAGDGAKALEHLRQAVTLDDHNVEAWMALGVVAFEQDSLFEAASAFDRASVLAPDRHEPLYDLAQVLESAGKYAKAAQKYEQALKLAPHDPAVMENLARCYVRLGQAAKAAPLAAKALKSEQRPEWRIWLEAQAANYPPMPGDKQ